jgi:hypothetical protein
MIWAPKVPLEEQAGCKKLSINNRHLRSPALGGIEDRYA